MAPPTQISHDIWNEIIDNVTGDISTLTACTLVCKTWLPRARLQLFRSTTIVLSTPQKCAALCSRLQEDLVGGLHFGRYVRRVALEWPLPSDDSNSALVLSTLKQLAEGTKLESLMLYSKIYKHPFDVQEVSSVLSTMGSLRALKMRHYSFRDLTEFAELLSALPRLEFLDTEDIVLKNHALPSRPAPWPSSISDVTIRSSRLEKRTARSLLYFMRGQDLRLLSLHMSVVSFSSDQDGVTTPGQFFYAPCFSSLEDLSINLSPDDASWRLARPPGGRSLAIACK